MAKITRNQLFEYLKEGRKDFSNLDLSDLDLSGAILTGLDLSCTDLKDTDLSHADLSYTKLSHADLTNADLSFANLTYADLAFADLTIAELTESDLQFTNLFRTHLDSSEQLRRGIILDHPMTGYKKCVDGLIVTLEIPAGAIVFSINNNKCRTNKAKVTAISNNCTRATSFYSKNFIYELGKEVEVKDFSLMYNIECASGIHFFKTRDEAERYC